MGALRGGRHLMLDESTLAKIRAELESSDPAARAQAAEAILSDGDAKGIATCLRSRDPYLRRMAIAGLARQAGERPTWRIAQTRFDRDEEVRCAVARALGG